MKEEPCSLSKVIKFRRLAERRVNVLRAFELACECRKEDGQQDFPDRQPHFWNIPTVLELESIRDRLIKDIGNSSLQMIPASLVFIWSFDEHRHIFTTYCPFTGETRDVDVAVLLRNAHDSHAQHFAYAVSVSTDEVG